MPILSLWLRGDAANGGARRTHGSKLAHGLLLYASLVTGLGIGAGARRYASAKLASSAFWSASVSNPSVRGFCGAVEAAGRRAIDPVRTELLGGDTLKTHRYCEATGAEGGCCLRICSSRGELRWRAHRAISMVTDEPSTLT